MKQLKNFLLILLVSINNLYAQSDTSLSLIPKNSTKLPIEKIKFFTDRDLYLSGERVWFKAYCLYDQILNDKELSKILYVELYNSEMAIKKKFFIKEGTAYGTFDIPEDMKSGNYTFRTYTNYLKNFSAEVFYTKNIEIVNPDIPLSIQEPSRNKNLITIISEKIVTLDGIKLTNALRISKNLYSGLQEIFIESSQDKLVTNVHMKNHGLGYFEFLLKPDHSYMLKIIGKNNDTITHPLTDIQKSPTIIQHEFDSFSLLDTNGRLKKFSNESLKNNSIQISLNKKEFNSREIVNLEIMPDLKGKDSQFNFSISVVKKGTLSEGHTIPPSVFDSQNHLQSFFRTTNINQLDQVQQNILRILSNRNILSKYENPFEQSQIENLEWLPEIRDIAISGYAKNKSSQKGVSDIPIYISVFKSPPQFHIIHTQKDGYFTYSLNNLSNSRNLFLCPKAPDASSIELQLNNDFFSAFKNVPYIPILIDSSHRSLLEELNINYQAGNIYKTDPGLKTIETKALPYNFGNPPVSVNLDKYVRTPTLEMVFNELVPRCSVNKKQGNYYFTVINDDEDLLYKNPLVLIDNIPVFDINSLMEINPLMVKNISVYTNPLILGGNLIEGIILITTNTDNFGGVKMPEGSAFLNYQMVSASKHFEAPIYSSEEKRQSRLADFRTTLYWNPELIFGEKKQISFYTSDHESEYEVVICGFSKTGDFYYGKTNFEVKNN